MRTGYWAKKDAALLAIIFYLLGVLTPLLVFIFIHVQDNTAGREKEEEIFTRPLSNEEKHELWETTTLLRNALYQFSQIKGSMPEDLSALGDDYLPERLKAIISSVPLSQTCTGSGGWVYKPLPIENEENMRELITKALTPNRECPQMDLPFAPVWLHIVKDKNTLILMSGTKKVKEYQVGLGGQGKTPEGTFYISHKVMHPNAPFFLPAENPYGERGMELSKSNYAIHGTNQPGSIGKNVSNGCIRMHNEDIKELYSILPIYSSVTITKSQENVRKPRKSIPIPDENNSTDITNVFLWAG